jgi:hypothetical protein
MTSMETILEQWFAQAIESYPRLTAHFLAAERDAFRNPVGHTLRDGMAVLLQEILGDMKPSKLSAALDGILRIRAVQDFKPSQAVGFIFLLRPILLGASPPRPAMLDARVEQLALMAFDHYVDCREDIARVRTNEVKRRSRTLNRN